MRMRAPGARGRERDALHALLAIASAAQQERKLPGQPEQLASPAASEAPASAPQPVRGDALQRMAESVCAVTEASGAAIAVVRGADMMCVASSGRSAIEMGASIDLDRGLAGRCVRSGEVQDCPDAESDARVNQEACRELGVRSLVMVPLRRRRRPALGVLAVFSDQRAHFSPRHMRFLEFMAGLVLEAAELGQPGASFVPARPAPSPSTRPLRLTDVLQGARARERSAPPAGIPEEEPPPRMPRSRLGIAGVALLLALVAATVVWTGWPQIQSRWRANPSPPPAGLRTPEPAAPAASPVPPESQAAPVAQAQPEAALPLALPAGRAQLTAVHYSTAPGGTRVTLELDRAVRYQARRLDNPARLVFDLENTHLALAGRSFPADDALLRSIRVAQFQRDVARVVLDLRAPAEYSATLEPAPPRLVIELRALPAPGR